MKNTVIKVENLSKQYRLGEIGTGSLAHDINRWWYNVRGKDDPYLKIGETNDRTTAGNSEYVWSLKDVNFDIKQGDAVGIIGRNGAGKSTLLKILSQVTAPTEGSVKVKGRIASLLEVGTGFHPDLSGRDNIYLNGAILGMRKAEIKRKFDEIVDFAGVERYIDTPVKRYSSGMYVRLAFAVAAHLESEILIVDEVLAVGDAEFQKKCLGKMGDVSKGEGRTVLFVSHNMASIKALCNSGIMLKNGTVLQQGEIAHIATLYNEVASTISNDDKELVSKDGRFSLKKPYWVDANGERVTFFAVGEKICLRFEFLFSSDVTRINPGFAVLDSQDQRIFTSHYLDDSGSISHEIYKGAVTLDSFIDIPLAPGVYKVLFGVRDEFDNTVIYSENLILEVQQTVTKNGADGILWYTSKWNRFTNI